MTDARDLMGGFAKGLRVIEAFAGVPRLTITEVAERVDLDRATARRCLLTLVALGYAEHDGKFFALTPKVARLGQAWLQGLPLATVIQPRLDRLSAEVGQSSSVSVLDGAEIVYIARAAQQRIMSINLMAGSRLPAFCSSMGRVLLAALPEGQAEALIRTADRRASTARTLTDPEVLMQELALVRRQGYAVIDQELEIGLCSIAVPVLNDRSEVIAALNIGAPAAQVPALEMAGRFLPSLRMVQAALRPLLA
ncbi:IclR family transcriptional regulator [Haematobacter missouriensis]|uniref:IclR family transcriptional regulator n=1 Tax=Haematobacter missouriensis TaxID=366616 RepID=A0A212AJQ8_9RHOB|nr:IclR family transcriptional regulator C-terminal domain-containing protein [Haematobacter missouriensis]KFI32828.1 IclR family transcriptional regulator [Haematobacter missouriensis]OWJ74654.1 IclR family transcriptional regulator [Haematobacter missouriensis]OWJ81656.1 IclR family transcriptional regulator [Haematobacter missouriensis]